MKREDEFGLTIHTSSSTGDSLNPVLRSPLPNFSRQMVPVLMGSSLRKNSSVRSRDLMNVVDDQKRRREEEWKKGRQH